MLGKVHFLFDASPTKCCFSSTMKLKTAFALGAMLVAFFVTSCAPPPGGSPLGLRSGDSASRIPWSRSVPQERPGLATGWGDERKSRMSYVSFVRSSQQPVGTDVIFYNDSEGIKAMAGNRERVGPMQTAAGELVEWGIKGKFGYLPTYKEHGFGRRLVGGTKGGNYSIVLKNRCKSALEIVTSVDGLDVMDGKTASFSKRGYIIDPGETLEIEGFRTSRSKVAAFEFSSVSDSYANLRHGDTRNIGVIGLAVFTQKGVNPWRWTSEEVRRRDSANPFAAAP